MSERTAVSGNVKSYGSGRADSNVKYILPLATTTTATCPVLVAEIHYMWWVGYDIITTILQLVLFGHKQKKKKYTVTDEHQ